MAIWGGGLTGIGIGIALACVLYAFERANGWGPVINSSVFIVLIVAGPAIGFGLGMAVAALIPNAERPPGPVTPSPDPVQIPAGGYTAGHPRST